jgi:putative YphP/YqiW family bacilliredoxin
MISLKSLMNDSAPTYAPEVAQPFRDELIEAGFTEMLTPADVDAALGQRDDQLKLVVLNSVCGCAARGARPGAIFSLVNPVVPDGYFTVFAGMEKEAVNHFRASYLPGLTPSSPNIALLKNGELVHLLQRHQIEGKNAGTIAAELTAAYNTHGGKQHTAEELAGLKNYLVQKYNIPIEALNG